MKTRLLASLLFVISGANAELAAKAVPSLRTRLTDEVIASAVRETLAQDASKTDPAPTGTVLSGGAYHSFSQAVAESKKPSCLGPDALKFQPAKMETKDWRFEAKGLTALPFWATAIARGKCN